ncbi:Helix-turn-helix domain-containing protein [Halobacillus karajensis]|uniref:Transcriptional activator NprA n=1 Tax=Halobacillus karajensis TaxID=195088 RepID=A0A024P452_9BACI|nr:helix-turn-helix transcriptional regulator [Halobacillus karajensis]CDQ18663.1 Transcriptional activator NprA [Halobacillus karajensis]CDQ23265.1 Transcriptional activator NprA [Halobacillus karajensis]CDQ26747.1 Transcriptional activator NprA [Halobacillus karajensis]SEH48457.1 Helix-turn-helix domain-containing protein [Halobacillus karajensis]
MKGSLIKQHRKFKNMTLEELASGICSVSYLSKIEHDTINASEEIYRHLGERLKIKLTDINQEFDQTIHQELLDWHEVIQRRDLPLMDEYYQKCTNALRTNQNTELNHLYKIVKSRHTMKLNEGPLSDDDLKEINDLYAYSNAEYKFFYHKTVGIHYLLKNHQFKTALHHFHKTEDLLKKLPFNDSETYFHLALTYSQTRAAVESNYYAHTALEGYIKDFDYERIVDTYMIIAINYRSLDIYSIAEEYFKKLIKIAKYHLKSVDERRIYHNLGFIYANQERYDEAFELLDKAFNMTIDVKDDFFYVNTIYLLASTNYYAGNVEKAWAYIDQGEKSAEEYDIQFFKYRFFVLRHTIQENTLADFFIEKLENEIIPYSREHNEYGDYKNYCEMLGNLYYEKRMYKKAAMYYKEVNNYRKTQKKDLL